jgi:hypothetical protein
VLRVANRIADCIRLAVPQATEWQRIGNEIQYFTGSVDKAPASAVR